MTESPARNDLIAKLTLGVGVVISVLLVVIYLQIRSMDGDQNEPPQAAAEVPSAATQLQRVGRRIHEKVGRSVVILNALNGGGANSPAIRQRDSEYGTGLIVDAEGYILTSLHVVADASRITAKLDDGRTLVAEVVGSDEASDLALLRIDAQQLEVIAWGDSDDLEVGTPVWTIGNPFGLEWSLSMGVVSGRHRRDVGRTTKLPLLQTDAAMSPGSSGGALVNEEGAVIGINTAILGKEFRGVSLAIPSRNAREVSDRLLIKAKPAQ